MDHGSTVHFLNVLNSLRKEIKCSANLAFYLFSYSRLKISIKHEHSCISKIFNLVLFGSPSLCSKNCDCINHCVDGEIGLLTTTAEIACRVRMAATIVTVPVLLEKAASSIFFLVVGSSRFCSKDCDCINHCVDGEIGLLTTTAVIACRVRITATIVTVPVLLEKAASPILFYF